MPDVNNIIDEIDLNVQKMKYENTKQLFEDVKTFIIKNKLILYGGFAVNILLPKKEQFYKDYTINDYDCYSKNAQVDALRLSKYLKSKKHSYIKVRKALHENTFKVFANFVVVADISQIETDVYNKMKEISLLEKKMGLYKNYKEKYILTPVVFLLSNMHYELARPLNSYYRWEKILQRLSLLSRVVSDKQKINKMQSLKREPSLLQKKLLSFIKEKKLPIVNEFALKYHNIYEYDKNEISVLSTDIHEIKKSIIEQFGKMYDLSIIKQNFIFNKTETLIISEKENQNNFCITVISANQDCFSVLKHRGFVVGSIHTIIYFIYQKLISSFIYNNTESDKKEKILTLKRIFLFENLVSLKNKELTSKCYGNNKSFVSMLKNQWKQRQTLKYI